MSLRFTDDQPKVMLLTAETVYGIRHDHIKLTRAHGR